MATTYELPTFKDPATFRPATGQVVRCVSFSPASWVINDVHKLMQLPIGAKLLSGNWYIESPDIDSSTGATVSLIVVDGSTTKTIISGSTIPQAGGIARDSTATVGDQTGWVGYTVTTKTAYVALKAAAAASGTFTTGVFKVQAHYTTDAEANDS